MQWVASDIGLRVRGRWSYRGVTVDAAPGELVTVVAEPDPGRALLTLGLSGRLRLSEGTVLFDDERLSAHRASKLAAVGWLDGMRLLEDRARVREVLTQAYRASRTPKAEKDLDGLLATAGLTDVAGVAASDLRSIQKAALGGAVARALRTPLVFVDVPPATDAGRQGIAATIDALRADGRSVVAVHHEAWPGSDRVVDVPSDPATDGEEAA